MGRHNSIFVFLPSSLATYLGHGDDKLPNCCLMSELGRTILCGRWWCDLLVWPRALLLLCFTKFIDLLGDGDGEEGDRGYASLNLPEFYFLQSVSGVSNRFVPAPICQSDERTGVKDGRWRPGMTSPRSTGSGTYIRASPLLSPWSPLYMVRFSCLRICFFRSIHYFHLYRSINTNCIMIPA